MPFDKLKIFVHNFVESLSSKPFVTQFLYLVAFFEHQFWLFILTEYILYTCVFYSRQCYDKRTVRCAKHPAYTWSEERPHPEGWIVGDLTCFQLPISRLEPVTTFKSHGTPLASIPKLPSVSLLGWFNKSTGPKGEAEMMDQQGPIGRSLPPQVQTVHRCMGRGPHEGVTLYHT